MNSRSPPADRLGAEDWAGTMGERWLEHLPAFEGMIAPIGAALAQRAEIGPGERVIDVGCGAGATSIDIARRVGRSGSVLGLDISPVLVDAAIRRGRAAKLDNLEFQCGDGSTFRFRGAPFDRLFSRFGLMFFEQPLEAFANLHGLLRAGARADFCVWGPAAQNAWVAEIMGIIGRHVELPAPVPHAPGPFAFDDTDYLRDILDRSGFRSVAIDSWTGQQLVGGAGASPREVAKFVLGALHFGQLLEDSAPDARETVGEELSELFERHRTAAGVAMPAKAFLVGACA